VDNNKEAIDEISTEEWYAQADAPATTACRNATNIAGGHAISADQRR